MTPLTIMLALALAGQTPSPSMPSSSNWLSTGRLMDASNLHLGVRPALYLDKGGEVDLGLTIQVSTNLL